MSGSLTDVVNRLGAIRFSDTSTAEVYQLVVRSIVEVVPGAGGATLALPDLGGSSTEVTAVASTHDLLLQLDAQAHPAADGRVQLLTKGDFSRWPSFADVAVRLGICDAVASPLRLRSNTHGCLTVYSIEGPFDQQSAVAAAVVAEQSASVVANAIAFEELNRTNRQLTEGLRSREVIGLAKGILMRQEQCSEADAFRILVRGSQRVNKKVREIAEQVVALAEGRSDVGADRG